MSQANAGDPRGVPRNVPQNLRGTCQGRLPSWRSDQSAPESAGHFREGHVPGVLARCSPGAFAKSASLGGGLREVLHAVLTYATISRMMPMRDNEHSQYQTVLPGDTGAPEYGELQHLDSLRMTRSASYRRSTSSYAPTSRASVATYVRSSICYREVATPGAASATR